MSAAEVGGLLETVGPWVYLVILLIAAGETGAFIGLLVPGEAIVLAAGILAGRGDLNTVLLIATVAVGASVGDAAGYMLGRRYGTRWTDRLAATPARKSRAARVQGWLGGRHGGAWVFAGRFVGFARPMIPFLAGTGRMGLRTFCSASVLAALAWAAAIVLAGVFVGEAAAGLLETAGFGALAVGAAAVVGVLLVARLRRPARDRARPGAIAWRMTDQEPENSVGIAG